MLYKEHLLQLSHLRGQTQLEEQRTLQVYIITRKKLHGYISQDFYKLKTS